ncbi:hypothetical protein [Halopiger goleimassiliensis]|uniref:hypothetical protein n=1 Tax=Halopiger goleimassiliensis TaxID=1293048 RepID=UPI0012B53690|nr:hypothetical protein [Halopiger goleimassiliensis]
MGSVVVLLGLVTSGVVLKETVPATWIAVIVHDEIRALAIAAAVLYMLVAPVAYALTNGGPVMAATLGIAPLAVAALGAGQVALTTDFAVALLTGATGAALATVVPAARRGEGWLPSWSASYENGLLVATGTTVIAVVAVATLASEPVAHPFRRHVPALVVATLVPTGLVAVGWVGWYRTRPNASRRTEEAIAAARERENG